MNLISISLAIIFTSSFVMSLMAQEGEAPGAAGGAPVGSPGVQAGPGVPVGSASPAGYNPSKGVGQPGYGGGYNQGHRRPGAQYHRMQGGGYKNRQQPGVYNNRRHGGYNHRRPGNNGNYGMKGVGQRRDRRQLPLMLLMAAPMVAPYAPQIKKGIKEGIEKIKHG